MIEKRTPGFVVCVLLVLATCLAGLEAEAPGQEPGRRKPIPAVEAFTLTGSPGAPFRQPTDAAFGKSSQIYVLDGLNGRVTVFNSQGQYLFSFGSQGTKAGELSMAVGIGCAPDGEVYVADTGNHRVQVFSPEGSFLRSFGLRGGDQADPTDVQPSALKDYCYVCDNDNHEIQVYDGKSGRFLARWGGPGKMIGKFRYPATLALDDQAHLYVVDVLNARLLSFDPYGKRGREVASWGVGPEGLYRPKGVAVDSSGRVFVSDSYMGLVKVFDADGNLLGVVADPEGQARRFTTPTSLASDGRVGLCVVETRASRVSVLRLTP